MAALFSFFRNNRRCFPRRKAVAYSLGHMSAQYKQPLRNTHGQDLFLPQVLEHVFWLIVIVSVLGAGSPTYGTARAWWALCPALLPL